MQYANYTFQQNADASQFFFESVGPNGQIAKAVIITPTAVPPIFNLALVDYDPSTDEFDDLAVSDNGDTAKILATIFQAVNLFLNRYPNRSIAFAGNTPARNRLYRMAINRSLLELSSLFLLFGFYNGTWESFDNRHNYEVYLVKKK